jgi:hypothetical protein
MDNGTSDLARQRTGILTPIRPYPSARAQFKGGGDEMLRELGAH